MEKNKKEKVLDVAEDAFEEKARIRKLRSDDRMKICRSRRSLKVILNNTGPGELLMMHKTVGAALEKAMQVSGKLWDRMGLSLYCRVANAYN